MSIDGPLIPAPNTITAESARFIPSIWSEDVLKAAQFESVLPMRVYPVWHNGELSEVHVDGKTYAGLLRNDQFENGWYPPEAHGEQPNYVGSIDGAKVYWDRDR